MSTGATKRRTANMARVELATLFGEHAESAEAFATKLIAALSAGEFVIVPAADALTPEIKAAIGRLLADRERLITDRINQYLTDRVNLLSGDATAEQIAEWAAGERSWICHALSADDADLALLQSVAEGEGARTTRAGRSGRSGNACRDCSPNPLTNGNHFDMVYTPDRGAVRAESDATGASKWQRSRPTWTAS